MQGLEINVGFGLAFVAGLLSFLSPCVLPIVPGYVTFVSGVTIEELAEGGAAATRRRAFIHSVAFGLGFGVVFMTLGATASVFGQRITQWLPVMTQIGGAVIILFGLHLLGAFRSIGFLQRDRRIHLSRHPGGLVGS